MKIKFNKFKKRFSPDNRKKLQKIEKAIARDIEKILRTSVLPIFNNSNFKNTIFGKTKYNKLLQMAREFSSSIYITILENIEIPLDWNISNVNNEMLEGIRNRLFPVIARIRVPISDNNTIALTPEDHHIIHHHLIAPLMNNWDEDHRDKYEN